MALTCKQMNTARDVWTTIDRWVQRGQRAALREAEARLRHDAALPASYDAVMSQKGAEYRALRMAELHQDIQSFLGKLNAQRFAQGCSIPHRGIGHGARILL